MLTRSGAWWVAWRVGVWLGGVTAAQRVGRPHAPARPALDMNGSVRDVIVDMNHLLVDMNPWLGDVNILPDDILVDAIIPCSAKMQVWRQ